jgi:S1-C subfamily serine protease
VSRSTGSFGKMFGNLGPTMGTHGAIANDVLGRFRILLDYPGKHIFLQRVANAMAPASASMVRVGVSMLFDTDGCPVVQRITSTNAPAVAKALQIGDVITTIDGQDACKMMHHEISAALAGKPGDAKRLGLRRGTKSSEVTVPVADLLGTSSAKP